MSHDIDALAQQVEALRAEITELDAVTEPTPEQSARFDAALDEFAAARSAHETAVERAAKRAALVEAAKDESNVERAFNAPHITIKRDPFDGIDANRAAMLDKNEVVARALTGIEQAQGALPEAQELATRMVEGTRTDVNVTTPAAIARHALLTGSPAYRSAWEKILQYPETFHSMLTPAEADAFRTAMSTSGSAGGYAIPFLLDPTVILSNVGSANPFRQIARIETGVSNKWNGLTSAGATAEWKTEGSAAADGSPAFAQPSITAYLADAFILGSFEVFEDTNLANSIPALIQDAKDRLEDAAFATGSGSGQPFGVVTSTTAVTASRVSPTTGGTFTTASRADVDKLLEAIPPRFRSRSSWVANYSTYGTVRRMDIYGGGSFWANLGGGQPQQLLGQNVYEAYSMTSTVTTGSSILLAGDFSQYLIFDRIGTTLEYVPNIFDTTSGRPTGQRGWLAHWRVGADVLVPNAFRVLKL